MADIGQNFRTSIPDLADAANIQEAFRLYHYGIPNEPDEANPISPNSLESHLQALADGISTGQIISPINDEDLNEIVTSGIFYKGTTPLSGKNYPTLSAGLLGVTATSTGVIFQTYTTVGGQLGTNKTYSRGRSSTSTDWGTWSELSVVGHSHNDIYYTESEIDLRVNPQNSQIANRNKVAIVDDQGRLSSLSSVNSTQLTYLTNVSSDIQSQLDDKAQAAHYHDDRYYLRSDVSNPQSGAKKTVRVFVQQATPTGAVDGDLWFW